LALLLWWHTWTTHPTSVTTCGCGDSSFVTWFLAWPAYAISHGLNPLYSTLLFHPTGVNLLSNPGAVGLGISLAPVTWLFGPVATLNVALTLAPFLSALAMFLLLRRWVTWQPAAFIGGLFYGFSPFVLISLTDAHLILGMAFVPPLLVLCLDELLIRQRWRPAATGVALGLLVAIQFLIGTESLALVGIAAVIGCVLVVLVSLRHAELIRQRARYALVALGSAVVTTVVLLAYPVWFTFGGPAHLSGPIWPAATDISFGGTTLRDYFLPSPPSALATSLGHQLGGYQAPTYSGQYFGLGLAAVLVIGLVVWRRDRRLWLFAALAVISVPLSFGLQFHRWTLWRLFVRFPLMANVIPSRFLLVTYLAAAVMLGLIVDHTVTTTNQRLRPHPVGANAADTPAHSAVPDGIARGPVRRPTWGALAGVAVGAIALVPIVVYYAPGLPFTTQAVLVPQWYRSVAPHLAKNQVILAFPVPWAYKQSAMTWQAVAGMPYAMVGGSGPASIPQRAGRERAGQAYIGHLSLIEAPDTVTPEQVSATRRALDGWGVTTVVVPDPSVQPSYQRVRNVSFIAAVITAATGRRPAHQAGAWVWSGVNHAGPPVQGTTAQFSQCAAARHPNTTAAVNHTTQCMLQETAVAAP
jgi:hypothetical protein